MNVVTLDCRDIPVKFISIEDNKLVLWLDNTGLQTETLELSEIDYIKPYK